MKAVGLMAIGFEEMIEGLVQLVDVVGDDVGQISILGLVPYVLDGIDFGCVCREPFDLEPLSTLLRKLSNGGTMSRQTITDEDKRAAQVRMDFTQEANKFRCSSVVVKEFVIQAKPSGPRRPRNCGQRRDPIVTIPRALNRCVSFRRPHSPPQRLQQIAAFIEKHQASLPLEALFLSAASLRGARVRCPVRCVRGHAVPASADSNRVCEANEARILDDGPRQRAAGSCPERAARSTRTARTPKSVSLATTRPPIRLVAESRASAFCLDEVSHAAYSRVARHSSTDTPKRHWRQPPQPLPSMSFPARTAGPRSSDGLRALRDFLMVSCKYCSGWSPIFH